MHWLGKRKVINMTRKVQTQLLVFSLFGDYIGARGGEIWTRHLLEMLALLDVTETAARLALSRMARKGWLQSTRVGRFSRYRLTRSGQRVTDEGGLRIFEPRAIEWDGQWHLVVYSMPEAKRGQRQRLRTRLGWLGYARLAPGTWISPYARLTDIEMISKDLDIEKHVQFFSGRHIGFTDDPVMVAQCWDLDALNQQYAEFIAKYRPDYEACREMLADPEGIPTDQCFVRRFWFTYDYTPFPLRDPNLPAELLPDAWLGNRANELFRLYRGILAPRSGRFVDEKLAQSPNR